MGDKNNTDAKVEDQTDKDKSKATDQGDDGKQMPLIDEGKTSDGSLQLRHELLKLRSDLEAANKKIRDAEAAKNEASGNFKALWEAERERAESLEQKLARNTEAFVTTQKREAAKSEFLKAGIRPEAMKILDKETFDELQVDIQEGKMKVFGTETMISRYKTEMPFLFAKPAPNVNAGGTGSGSGDDKSTGEFTSASQVDAVERKFGVKSMEYRAAMSKFLEYKRTKQATR